MLCAQCDAKCNLPYLKPLSSNGHSPFPFRIAFTIRITILVLAIASNAFCWLWTATHMYNVHAHMCWMWIRNSIFATCIAVGCLFSNLQNDSLVCVWILCSVNFSRRKIYQFILELEFRSNTRSGAKRVFHKIRYRHRHRSYHRMGERVTDKSLIRCNIFVCIVRSNISRGQTKWCRSILHGKHRIIVSSGGEQ